MSTENATVLTNSERWPLMIDPQLQGNKWVKNQFKDNIAIIQLGKKGYITLNGTLLLERSAITSMY